MYQKIAIHPRGGSGRRRGAEVKKNASVTHLAEGEEVFLQLLPLGRGLLALPSYELEHFQASSSLYPLLISIFKLRSAAASLASFSL